MPDRRTFLKTLAATAAVAPVARALASQLPLAPAVQFSTKIHKATLISMLPKEMSYAVRFALARDVGFEGIEMQTIEKPEEASEIREASQKTGLRIHSVMNMDHWRLPLSSGDPQVVNGSVKGMETSLRNAALWGAETVLLVPAVVDANTSYKDAYTRSQRVIRERLLPLAKDVKVAIAVEEVWNKFPSVRSSSPATSMSSSRHTSAPTSTSATSSCTRSRRTGSGRSARASPRSI